MKIKVSYKIKQEKEIEMTPEEYCVFRANFSSWGHLFPEKSWDMDIEIADEKSKQELERYFWEKQGH